MIVKSLIALASAHFPYLADNLTLEQLVHFCNIGSDFIRRTHAIFPVSPISAPIEFLQASLPPVVSPSYWAALWNLTFPSIFACHLNSDEAFRSLGIPSVNRPGSSLEIPEMVLEPPVDYCLQCDPAQHRGLTKRPAMRGYLYDLDGVRTVHHLTRYCRCELDF